jgi:hypothetical protein
MKSSAVLALFVASCGGGSTAHSGTDASADGESDTPPLTTGTLRVTVSRPIYPSTAPSPTVGDSVVFNDSIQTQVVVTDANGQASATVTGPTTITDVQFVGGKTSILWTLFGAEPGDDIVLRQPGGDNNAYSPVTVNFQIDGGATSYLACTPCGCSSSATSPIMVQMSGTCASDPTTVTLVELNGQAAQSYVTTTTPYSTASGGTVTMPTQMTAARTLTGNFSNIPSFVDHIAFSYGPSGSYVSKESGAVPTTFSTQLQIWDIAPAAAFTFVSDYDKSRGQLFMDPVTGSTTAVSIDMAASPPWLDEPTFDPSTRTLGAATSEASQADIYFTDLAYPNSAGDANVNWYMFAANPDAIVLPPIPMSVVDTTAHPPVDHPHGKLIDLGSVDGFSAARLDPIRFVSRPQAGQDDSLRISYSPNSSLL